MRGGVSQGEGSPRDDRKPAKGGAVRGLPCRNSLGEGGGHQKISRAPQRQPEERGGSEGAQAEKTLEKAMGVPRNFGNIDPCPEMSYNKRRGKKEVGCSPHWHPKWYDVLSRGGRIASFMPGGQCLAAKSVEPLLSQMFWVRGTGTHLLSMGMVTVSAAQQGVNVPARPSAEGREAPQG